MTQLQIKTDNNTGRAYIYTPYNADFVNAIKGIGGAKWNSSERAWTIPAESIPQARDIMRRIYGVTDQVDGTEMVSLELTFNGTESEYCSPVTLFGKTISRAYGRDSGAQCGEDVAFVQGAPESGGSVKNWCSVVPSGSVVVLHNVPKSLLDNPLPDYISVKLLDKQIDRNALINERNRLMDRLAEIDDLLK